MLFTSHTAVFLSVDVGIYTDCIAVCCCWYMCVYLWVRRCVGYVREQTKPKECTNASGKANTLSSLSLFFRFLSINMLLYRQTMLTMDELCQSETEKWFLIIILLFANNRLFLLFFLLLFYFSLSFFLLSTINCFCCVFTIIFLFFFLFLYCQSRIRIVNLPSLIIAIFKVRPLSS